MVAPVIQYLARSKDVYFPGGTDWVCAGIGKIYHGETRTTVDAPLDQIPLFYRKGVNLQIYG